MEKKMTKEKEIKLRYAGTNLFIKESNYKDLISKGFSGFDIAGSLYINYLRKNSKAIL